MWLSKLTFIPSALQDAVAPPQAQAPNAYTDVEEGDARSSRPIGTLTIGATPSLPVLTTAVEIAAAMEHLLPSWCLACWKCRDGHELVDGPLPPNGGYVGFHPESCGAGDCSLHPRCGGDGDASDATALHLSASLKAVAADELTALVAKHPNRVRINRDRRTLQLIGCQDQVVASYGVASIPALELVLQ